HFPQQRHGLREFHSRTHIRALADPPHRVCYPSFAASLPKVDPQMFVSFFPRPRLFFLSAILWTALAMAFWYGYASDLIGSPEPGAVGVALFWSARSLWFDLYFALSVGIF